FELLKTSQWGGSNYSKNISAFKSAIIGNTNEKKHSNINQLAGFGLSYLTNFNEVPVTFYSQLIGEDESGNLPSCFMKMIGLETDLNTKKYPSTFGVEYVDTRISFTTTLHCGPNTAYNNATYKYNNYDQSLGAAIGSEGKSISFWGTTEISNNIFINYSFEDIIINDSDWSQHHLSSNKQDGNLITFGASYNRNNFKIQSQVSYQDFGLDKIGILEGSSIRLNTTLAF
ncbi:capsule assembly Wzi family protein, partial [Amylibacter sp.]|nr:capsule assembly Wzi family protein [Amylibacter sp.]